MNIQCCFFTLEQQPVPLDCSGFEIIHSHTTLGMSPLDEGLTRRRPKAKAIPLQAVTDP
jgi:hypothetical protein